MNTARQIRRRYLRHAADIPIEVESELSPVHEHTNDISYGGLSFMSDRALPLGHEVKLAINVTQPKFEESARVVWCQKRDRGYEIGVEFMAKDAAFRARMVEQVCYIEQYRQRVRETEGRILSPQQAAMEWIERYAAQFDPQDDDPQGVT